MQQNVEQKEWGLHNEGIKACFFFFFFLMRSEGLKSKQVSIIQLRDTEDCVWKLAQSNTLTSQTLSFERDLTKMKARKSGYCINWYS